MIFFLLLVFSNLSLNILYKVSERFGCKPLKIALVQFASATLFSVIYIYFVEGFGFNLYVLLIGAIGGIATYGAIHAFLVLIKLGYFGLSTLIINLSISIPIIVSILIFKENSSFYTYIAFGLIILTFYLMAEKGDSEEIKKRNRAWILLALASMIFSGIADTGPKVIQELDLSSMSMSYLGYNYFFAFLITLAITMKKKIFPGKKELLIGTSMGISILFGMFFMVMTLRIIPGTILYPLNKTLISVIIVLISFFIWKERLRPKQVFGVFTAICSVILLSLSL